MEKKQNNNYNKIKKCEKKNITKEIPKFHTNHNNFKSSKYFTIDNSENQIKKALTKYREKISKNNPYNKTISTTDATNTINKKKFVLKNNSFKIDKNILTYAEPRITLTKIQPKIIDSFLLDDNFLDDNNTNETIINEEDSSYSELELIDNFTGINNFKNINDISEEVDDKKNILEKKNLNEFFDFNINDINLEFLVMIEKLYNELIKDIEINKMDIYQNKLSIMKDLLYIYHSEENNKLLNAIDNILFNNNCFYLSNIGNNTFNKNFDIKKSNNKFQIFLIIKEFIIYQIIFFYIVILISLIKKEKNNYQSGLHIISFYFHQNIILLIYIIFSNYKNSISKNNENKEKCNKILNENKTWLDKNNYKKYLSTNNSLSKQIIINLLKQIKSNFTDDKNNNNNNNNKLIISIINILLSNIKNFEKNKIIKILIEIKSNKYIQDLFQKLNFNKIISHYDNTASLNSKSDQTSEFNIESNPNINAGNLSLKPPFLKPLSSKYKYTLVLDLDETLVHYIDDDDSAYIQVRPGAEEFIKELSEFYEIIIFTAALQTYADLIITGLDPDGLISDKLYRQHTKSIGSYNVKDLNKLGRDLKKTIIIDNIKENFCLQKKNGLKIEDFEGNEYDDELDYLKEDLIKLVKLNPDDVRYYLRDIQKKMDDRATYFKQLNDKANLEFNDDDNNNINIKEEYNNTMHNNNNNNLFKEIINENEL